MARGRACDRLPDRAIIDLMLAHVPANRVEGAYNRAAYMPRRRELAQEWADILLADMWPPAIHIGQPIWCGRGRTPRPLIRYVTLPRAQASTSLSRHRAHLWPSLR
jgi:hypothetical protein